MYHTLLDGAICLRMDKAGEYSMLTAKDRPTTMFTENESFFIRRNQG